MHTAPWSLQFAVVCRSLDLRLQIQHPSTQSTAFCVLRHHRRLMMNILPTMNQLTDIDTDIPATTNKTSPLAPASLSGSRAHGSCKIEDDSPSPGQANRKPTENTLLLRPQDTPLPCLSIHVAPQMFFKGERCHQCHSLPARTRP